MRKNSIAIALMSLPTVLMSSLSRFGTIKMEYDKETDIPEAHKELYTERDGKWLLTQVEGGGYDNFARITEAHRKEKEDHKSTKAKYSKLNGRNVDELLQRDSEYDELKLKAENNNLDETKIEQMVGLRLKSKVAPLERENNELKTKLATIEDENTALKGKEVSRKIRDHIRSAATKLKVTDTALEDVEILGARLFELDDTGRVVAKENVGVTPGIDAEMWLSDQREKKPHWFPGNVGGGSGGGRGGNGSGAGNPWSHDGWNLTEQGKILREDRAKAERMAAMHGVTLTNPKRPAKK